MKSLLDLEPNECRYPMNDGGPYLFCAEVQATGSSYCAAHRDVSFRRVQEHCRDIERPAYAAAIRKNLQPACFVLMEKAE